MSIEVHCYRHNTQSQHMLQRLLLISFLSFICFICLKFHEDISGKWKCLLCNLVFQVNRFNGVYMNHRSSWTPALTSLTNSERRQLLGVCPLGPDGLSLFPLVFTVLCCLLVVISPCLNSWVRADSGSAAVAETEVTKHSLSAEDIQAAHFLCFQRECFPFIRSLLHIWYCLDWKPLCDAYRIQKSWIRWNKWKLLWLRRNIDTLTRWIIRVIHSTEETIR